MRKIFWWLILIITIIFAYNYRENIVQLYNQYFVSIEDKVSKLEKNAYYRDYNYSYVQNTTSFIPNNKQELLNIFYTIINSGMTEFTFYCPSSYANCIQDAKDLTNNQDSISNINNFVHPYNSFKNIHALIESTGKISIKIDKLYTDEMIIILNYKVEEILKNNIKTTDTLKEKIKKIHDYIINNTTYDKARSDNQITEYKSDNAYGVLIEGFGICGGYTDSMMLFLEQLNVPNFKISTENHIWNAVYVDSQWLHLDLTWDDPVTEDNKGVLDDSYFLINDEQLETIEKEEHNYDKKIFKQ